MFRKIIILLTVASPCILSRNHESWKNSGDVVNDLGWLFDIEESEGKIKHADKTNTVCETDGCKYLSKLILKGMNKTADPCDDFYKYVCGQWNSEIMIPPHEPSWGHTQMFQAAVYDRLKKILETEPEPSDILPVRQAKKWYRACMNMNDLEKRGIKPLESILMQTGGWPMTMDEEEWNENDHSWQNIERYYFRLTGSYIFYDMELERRMTIIDGKIPLANDFPGKYRNYTGNDYGAYLDLIEGVVREFVEHNKANIEPDVIERNVQDVVEFEKKLYMLSQDTDRKYERKTVGDLVESYKNNTDNFEATNLINLRLMIEDYFAMGNVILNDSFPIEIICRSYLEDLTKLLSKTPKKTIINYLHWHFISNMLHFTSEKLRQLLFKLKEIEYGVKERPPRWYECVEEIQMKDATSYAFVQKYFPKTAETTALKMIEHIRTEMESQIDDSNWMDDESKKLIVDKLNTMRIFLGFPDWYRNKTAVINAYKGLTIGTNYIDNVLSFQRYSAKVKVQRLKNMNFDEEPWLDVRPTIVNAFYDPRENSINLPAADFQPPLFTAHLPDNINYGIVGAVVGHEIGHAFDDSGIKYGNDGNPTKLRKDWLELYYKRAVCFLDQFNEYYGVTEPIYEGTTPDVLYDNPDKISAGRRTRGENIADTTGLHSTFQAYNKILQKRSRPDLKLPGFEEFSDEQMFFIAFGVSWCEVVRPEYAKQVEKEDAHSSNRLRVIGTVSNTNDFTKAFQCPKGSMMNPENKCNIWKSLPEDENELSYWPRD